MSLITRNHAKLTLEGARAVLAAAERHATEMQVSMNIAVVDDGGHLLAFARMDGAKPSSIAISLVKARAAAMRRAPTGPAMAGDHVNVALALGLASARPDQQTPIRGGVPLSVEGKWWARSASAPEPKIRISRSRAPAPRSSRKPSLESHAPASTHEDNTRMVELLKHLFARTSDVRGMISGAARSRCA